MATEIPSRPLRRDAARNRERILAAAGELFARRGLGVTLNDVAHHAGVGVGTVYRHFPHKNELIETLFHESVEEMVAIGEEGLADPDPWHGLVTSMRQALELRAADRGLHELVNDTPANLDRLVHVRSRMLPLASELLRRAQDAGAVRADIDATDLVMTQLMVGAVLDASREAAPQVWRRYFDMLMRSLAVDPEGLGPLTTAPLREHELDVVMTAYKECHR